MAVQQRPGKVQTTISLDQEKFERCQRQVQALDRSFNWIVNKALEEYLLRSEKEKHEG